MYRIEFDENELLITATLEGFWTSETVAGYSADLSSTMRKARVGHDFMRMLALSQGMAIQSPEVSQKFGALTQELTKIFPGPIAIVAGSVLNKMQASRALAHERVRVFTDVEEARAWLMSIGSDLPKEVL